MNKQKMALVISLTLSIALLCGCQPATPSTPTPDPEEEEYRVYSAVIQARYTRDDTKLVVIIDQTDLPAEDLDQRLEGDLKETFKLKSDLIENFKAQNQGPQALKNAFELSLPYQLVTKEEIRKLFQRQGGGWQEFYEKYPDSQGHITLSRVGFNKQTTQALLYVGNQFGDLAGTGYYYLLSKQDGNWVIADEIMVWIS